MKKLSKKEWIAVSLAIVFVAYTLFGGNIMALFQRGFSNGEAAAVGGADLGSSGITVADVLAGQGKEAKSGDQVAVNYVLALQDGTVIQNSKDFGVPFTFTLGAGDVIAGWEKGIEGMKVGGIRTIVVPPELGYGARGNGPIPPNATLVFTIELVEIQAGIPQAVQ